MTDLVEHISTVLNSLDPSGTGEVGIIFEDPCAHSGFAAVWLQAGDRAEQIGEMIFTVSRFGAMSIRLDRVEQVVYDVPPSTFGLTLEKWDDQEKETDEANTIEVKDPRLQNLSYI
jgi:hypothetical protein